LVNAGSPLCGPPATTAAAGLWLGHVLHTSLCFVEEMAQNVTPQKIIKIIKTLDRRAVEA
jgi:hypothetical protein